jgi:hypothetical protein
MLVWQMVNFAAVLCHQIFQNRATVGHVNKAASILTLYSSLLSAFLPLRGLGVIVFGIIVGQNMEFMMGQNETLEARPLWK